MGEKKADPMDVEKVLDALNEALALQRRSVLQYTTAAGSMFGLEVQGLTGELWQFAVEEQTDMRKLVEKISALGGEPTLDVAPMDWTSDPQATIEHLIECEDEGIAALHEVIPHSGQEPRSEALEHLMEHLIMRKQNQVDWLRRAARRP
jgi:bacterioferritin (cytochrome b1)